MTFIDVADTDRFTLDRAKLRARLIGDLGRADGIRTDGGTTSLAFASYFAIAQRAGAIVGPAGLQAEVHALDEYRDEHRILATIRERDGVPLRQVATFPFDARMLDRRDSERFDGACEVLCAILGWINALIPAYVDLRDGERRRSRTTRRRLPPERSQLAERLDACGWPSVAADVRDGLGLDMIRSTLGEDHRDNVASASAIIDGERIPIAGDVATDHEACMIARRWFNTQDRDVNVLAQLAHDGSIVDPIQVRGALMEGMHAALAGAPGFPATVKGCVAERAALEAYLATRTDFGPVDGWG